MKEPEHPAAVIRRILFAGVFMPVLVGVAWWKAADFDPYTSSFFTKTYIEPTLGMPGELRMAGWVFIGVGVLLFAITLYGLLRIRVVLREVAVVIWVAVLFMAFGGAFFVAADSAQEAITARESTR